MTHDSHPAAAAAADTPPAPPPKIKKKVTTRHRVRYTVTVVTCEVFHLGQTSSDWNSRYHFSIFQLTPAKLSTANKSRNLRFRSFIIERASLYTNIFLAKCFGLVSNLKQFLGGFLRSFPRDFWKKKIALFQRKTKFWL